MKIILNRSLLIFTVFALILTMAACAGGNGEGNGNDNGEELDTLIFAESDWESHQVHNQIAGFIVEHGYGLDFATAYGSTPAVVQALRDGDMHVNMEMWSDNVSSYEEDLENEEYHELSVNFDDNYQGIWIPEYLQEEHPDLQSIHDLPDYKHLFENPDEPNWDPEEDKGLLYLGSSEFAATDFYNTKFEENDDYSEIAENFIFEPVSTSVLNTELNKAYEDEEPWVGYHWTPTAIMAELDMVLLEDDAEYDNETGDGMLPPTDVTVIATDSLMDAHPEIVEFLENYETDADITGDALIFMEENDGDPEIAAREWLREYEDLWTEWVPDDVADDVLDALDE